MGGEPGEARRSARADADQTHVLVQDIVDATAFLLENEAMNGVNLPVDGGWLLM